MSYLDDPTWYVYSDGDNMNFVRRDAPQGTGLFWVDQESFDLLAVMRVGHLVRQGRLEAVTKQATRRGSLGADALRELRGEQTVLGEIMREWDPRRGRRWWHRLLPMGSTR